MGVVIGPEVLVRKRAQKNLDEVNRLMKLAKTLHELAFLAQLRKEHEETIKATYQTGGQNDTRDTHSDVDSRDTKIEWNNGDLYIETSFDGSELTSANDEDGGTSTEAGSKKGTRDDDNDGF